MRSHNKLLDIGLEILHRMYKASTPPLNFHKYYIDIAKGNIKCDPDWYMKHKITEAKYNEIVTKAEKEFKLTKHERSELGMLFLQYSPTFLQKKR